MKKLCKTAFFFAPLFCFLFLQGCHSTTGNATANETAETVQSTVPMLKDTETTVFPEATVQSETMTPETAAPQTAAPDTASKQETEETLDDILDQLDELDAILDGH